VFGFIAESVFTIIPESCSGSPWNTVRNHPGIAFTFARAGTCGESLSHSELRAAVMVAGREIRKPNFARRYFAFSSLR
jgi:hypothetical protein